MVSEEYVVYFYINACLYVNPNGCAESPFNNSYSVFFKSIYIISSKNVIVVVSEEYVVYFYINACLYVNPNGCAQSPFNNSYSVFLIIVNTIGQLSLLLGLSPNLLICPPL